MSQENTVAVRGVRIPLAGAATRRHRTLDERIAVRFPALNRWLSAAWAELPRNSRLRRALLVRGVRQGFAAGNRRDFDFLLTRFDPGIEYHFPEPWQVDFDPLYHGHDGYREAWRVILEAFEDARLDPMELLDLGGRFLVTVEMSGHGAGSGVSISQRLFQLYTLRRGLAVRQDDFQDRAAALEAVGLSEQDAHADP
jgi:ketosteroid isomerase-like protein